MKKIVLLLGSCVTLAACSSNTDQPATARVAKEQEVNLPPPATAPAVATAHDSALATNTAAVDNQMQADTNATKIGTAPTGSPHSKGGQLLAASDCASCHKEREKLLGPAYTAIAAKYPSTPANVAMLAKKIISGGKGHWGDIAMTPHPGLSESDAKEMTRYVLSLK